MENISTDILVAAAEGNMNAFEQIYKAASGFVYNIALRITNNGNDAEEITQDVFLKIYKNLKRFRFRASFRTWVYRIAVNTAISSYRKKIGEVRRRGDYDLALKTEAVASEVRSNADKEYNSSLVSRLLGILSPEQRACIVLREMEDLSYKEIARILKININTVRSRLKRARETIIAHGQKEVILNEL